MSCVIIRIASCNCSPDKNIILIPIILCSSTMQGRVLFAKKNQKPKKEMLCSFLQKIARNTKKRKTIALATPSFLFLLKKMSTMLRTENPDAEVTKTMSIIIMSKTDIVSNEYAQVTTKQIAFFFSSFALLYIFL